MKVNATSAVFLITLAATSITASPAPIDARWKAQVTKTASGSSSATGSAVASINSSNNTGTSLPGLPAGCMLSSKGIAWGWLPDDMDSSVSVSSLNSATGKKACFYGDYSKINDASYDGSDITGKGARAEGAIMVPSVMPVGVKWDQVDASLASKIGGAMNSFTKQGLTVYLRFAHEMNCYAKPGCGSPAYPGGEDYAGFKQAWIHVARECKAIDGCYMMWSPNGQDYSSLSNWWPGADYVDIVAVDHYPGDDDVSSGFSSNYDDFYNVIKSYGKPFILGETAVGGSAETKDTWVKTITNSDFTKYPLYKGAMWFEYNKEADFYVVHNADASAITAFDSNFH